MAIFVVFLWLGPIRSGLIEELMEFFTKTNLKEKSGEQELTGTEVATKIVK